MRHFIKIGTVEFVIFAHEDLNAIGLAKQTQKFVRANTEFEGVTYYIEEER